MEKTSYKDSVQKKPASSFDPYCPLPKEQWEKKIADAEEDVRNGRVYNGFDVYEEMIKKVPPDGANPPGGSTSIN